MSVDISTPFRGRKLDGEQLRKAVVKTYRDERRRRVRTVDDEYRDDIPTNLPCGTFSLSNVSAHDLWQEQFYDRFGGVINPLNTNYRCKHCGTEFAGGFPPEECPVCHTLTDFGLLVKSRFFSR